MGKEKNDSDEHEKDIFAGYTKVQRESVSRFNRSVIEYAKALQKKVNKARKNDKVRGETGGQK